MHNGSIEKMPRTRNKVINMRIIAGKYRGRRIKQPETALTRPTKDRIREAVFNMIGQYFPGKRVLDLFAGSGAFGLEAISRGADSCVFVEQNIECANVIKENLDSLRITDNIEIRITNVFEYIEFLHKNKTKFNLILADPPYAQGMAKKTLIMVNQYDILEPIGLLILEHHKQEDCCVRF